jgi:methyl-accepting chemotaxis protein
MKFSTQVMVCLLVPLAAAGGASGFGLLGLQGAQQRFESLFHREQPLAEAAREMYAQGLQMGQAARNIVLDPKNRKAYDNLAKAAEDYEKAVGEARAAAVGDDAVLAALDEIGALRAAQRTKQERLLELVGKDPAAAIAHLNAEETPAWRKLKDKLLALGETMRTQMQAMRAEALADTERSTLYVQVLTGVGLLLAAVFAWNLRRVLWRNIGGEPEVARRLMQAAAAGDLSETVPVRAGDADSLFHYTERMQASLRDLIGGVRASIGSITASLSEFASGNSDLASRTSEEAARLDSAAVAMRELLGNVRGNAETARRASELASSASGVASRGGEVVGQVVTTMEAIRAQSKKIGEIVDVIDGIAFQTNLLALNAAVEAARAGDHGRGFAVVAEEVRGLAQRAAKAAREINELIAASSTQVEGGARLVEDAGKTMQDVVAQARGVTDLVAGIASAAADQSAGIEQVSGAVGQLDQSTQQNAALVEENAAVAASLREQAQNLERSVAVFRTAGVGGVATVLG